MSVVPTTLASITGSDPMNFSVSGISSVFNKLQALTEEVPSALDKALYAEGLQIFRASQKLVPVKFGTLKGSGVIEGPTNGEVFIGYGGAAASYALYVHEDMEATHKKNKSAKFLEIPFTEALNGMDERLAPYLERALEGKEQSAPQTESSGSEGSES
jgi:hypothetical protein